MTEFQAATGDGEQAKFGGREDAMKKFLWKIYLFWHGYCTRHAVEKKWSGYDPDAMEHYCPECEKERDVKHKRRIQAAKAALQLKTD